MISGKNEKNDVLINKNIMFGWITELLNLKKENKELKELLIKAQQPKIIFGVIDTPTKEDLEKIGKNKDIIKLIIKYLTYKIVTRTDMMRNLKDGNCYEEKVGYLNALNDLCLFFYNYLPKEVKKQEYSGQNLK